MAILIEMPKLSDTMEEGTLVTWYKKEGDTVSMGEIIADVDTDKATMEVEAFEEGVLLKIVAKEGEAVELGSPIAVIGEKGEDFSALLEGQKASLKESDDKEIQNTPSDSDAFVENEEDIEQKAKESEAIETAHDRIKVSPAARVIAANKGLDLKTIKGTGPGGRIIKNDVVFLEDQSSDVIAVSDASKQTISSYTGIRKTIGNRLSQSKFSSPHFYVTTEIDAENLMEVKTKLNKKSPSVSYNDILLKIIGQALVKHPQINSSLQGEQIISYPYAHIAMAVAAPDGLVTPVVKNVQDKSVVEISKTTDELIQKAKQKSLKIKELEGSTFSISNMGMFGVDEFTAIINPPNAAILAISSIQSKPVVKDGEIVAGNTLKLTLSSDHRVIDGAAAAKFLKTIKRSIEEPLLGMMY